MRKPRPMTPDEAVASAMRMAYGKSVGDNIKAWRDADPKVKRAWLLCARTARRVIEQEGLSSAEG